MVRQETETAKAEYENLLTDVSQGKRNLESTLSQWGDFDRSYEHFLSWLTEVENKLKSDPDLRVDLPEKRSSLERYKVSYCRGVRDICKQGIISPLTVRTLNG